MIEYLEIRDKDTRKLIGIVDTASSIIWKSVYYGVGQFEIYVQATELTLSLLQKGNYVTRTDDDECGIIEHTEINDNASDGKMITASGRFVKSILDRRIVYSAALDGTGLNYIWKCSATILSGNVEKAVRNLIRDNAVDCKFNHNRDIPEIDLNDEDLSGIPDTIVTTTDTTTEDAEKQVTYKNLLEYSDSVLQEYSCGATMWLDRSTLRFRYKVFRGADRSRDSAENQPVIFSKEFDNLTSMTYVQDDSTSKTMALVGGSGEGTDRGCALVSDWLTGLDRKEVFVDSSSIAQDETTSVADYRKQLEAQGRQSLAELQETETFDGKIDLTNSNLVYREDFNLGDLITIEDKEMSKYTNTRILSVTEVQDDNEYNIDIEYGI